MHAAEARDLFERELATIDRLIASVCRRYGIEGDDADSFASCVRLKLIEDDYAVLRQFSGRSSLKTYLSVVVSNCYRDYRIRRTGRWRPSALARRSGPAAVMLDCYLHRDGHTLEEAIQRVLSREDTDEDEAELRRIAAQLPAHVPRRFASLHDAGPLPSEQGADALVRESERAAALGGASEVLESALAELPEEDQVIVRLRFWEGLTVASIARTLGIEQKPLYRRIDRTLRTLRAALEAHGIEEGDVQELIEA